MGGSTEGKGLRPLLSRRVGINQYSITFGFIENNTQLKPDQVLQQFGDPFNEMMRQENT
jgi:hypothetical protein